MSKRELKDVGLVTHYYTRLRVALVELTGNLSVGNRILIRGGTTNFEQTIESIQIEHESITSAKSGQIIGLKVDQRVREGDKVYRVT